MALARQNFTRPVGSVSLSSLAAVVAVMLAACGSSSSSTSAISHGSGSPSPRMSEHMPEHAMTVGTDCGMVPSAGMGSMQSMAGEPVVTAASHDPLLTTLAAEVQKAGLVASLNSARKITVFAPDDQAFKSLSTHDMTMMNTRASLAKILGYHVVRGQIVPADFASSMTLTTLAGSQLKLSKMGSSYEVNNAVITCGNLHTANATVYIINKVLLPSR